MTTHTSYGGNRLYNSTSILSKDKANIWEALGPHKSKTATYLCTYVHTWPGTASCVAIYVAYACTVHIDTYS